MEFKLTDDAERRATARRACLHVAVECNDRLVAVWGGALDGDVTCVASCRTSRRGAFRNLNRNAGGSKDAKLNSSRKSRSRCCGSYERPPSGTVAVAVVSGSGAKEDAQRESCFCTWVR